MSENPVAITQALVQIRSVNAGYDPSSPGAAPVFDWIEAWARERGFAVERYPVPGGMQNLVLRIDNGPGLHLLFNGHCDTVSVEGMTIDPFSGEIRNDGEGERLWGRGACDMKGSVAAMLVAAHRLLQDRDSWRGTLTLGFTPDEEVATAGIRALMTEIPRPDFAIVGEPSCLKPVRGCKGGLRFALRCHGVAAHSSRPERGRSAIGAMARAILALNDYFANVLGAITRPQFGSSTGSIGLISGGTGINIVPDECTIKVDIRLVPGQCPDETYDALQAWFHREFPDGDGIRWVFELIHKDPAFEIAPDHPFTKLAGEVTGVTDPEVAFYCCDASKIAAVGVPCLILGAGDIAQAHTANEFIDVAQIEQGVEVYERIARKILV